MDELKIKMYSFTLDCKNPDELAEFYAKLLKWEVMFSSEEFAVIGAPGVQQGAYPGIMFQQNTGYIPPVWPASKEAQWKCQIWFSHRTHRKLIMDRTLSS